MSLFENFPYTNLHELNLDWLVKMIEDLKDTQVLSVNGQTGDVILYQNAIMQLPNVEDDHWSIIRLADGSQRGIMFANDGTGYIVHGNTMSQIYSTNNQPPYPVTSVNSHTGNVTLYTEQYVQLPTLSDAQMQNWTFFRTLNNVSEGIQFNDDGTADIIHGSQRFRIYDKNAYPTIGNSGSIVLFTENNNLLELPADAQATAWGLSKSINNVNTGLGFTDNGDLVLLVGSDAYPVYTALNPGWVEDPTDDTIIINTQTVGADWGFIRETSEGYVGILLSNDSNLSEPSAYVQYIDSNDQTQTIKLLTAADIPATGVYTVNGMAGTVVLDGSNIMTGPGGTLSIQTVLSRLSANFAPLYSSSTAYQKGDYSTRNNYLNKANKPTTGTFTPADWDATTFAAEIQEIHNLINNIQTVQKQVSTSTTYTCSDPSGEYYTISDLEYTTTGKELVLVTCHLEISSTKQYINYRIGESWGISNVYGSSHFLNNSYCGIYNANTAIPFRIRLENNDSITYGGANLIQAGVTYTIIPLE